MKRSSIRNLAPLFLVYPAFTAMAMAQSRPVVWIASSLHRVGMSDAAGSGAEVNLSAARDEYQSFQIVVSGASNGLSNVNVKISDLEGPGREVIPRTSFTLYREKYVHVTASSPNWGGQTSPWVLAGIRMLSFHLPTRRPASRYRARL